MKVPEMLLEPGIKQAIAIIDGHALTKIPQDLYIPPDALRIFLEAFEGPLDLMLYLIKKQNLDILNIPIAEVTRQYIEYVELMQEFNLELAAEYLVMASFLAETKSRFLLPQRSLTQETEGSDPRAELIRRLQEYERFKKAAEEIDVLPRVERDIFLTTVDVPLLKKVQVQPKIELKELLVALATVLQRAKLNSHHQIKLEALSVRERMIEILNKIRRDVFTQFSELFSLSEGRLGVVVSFIAILELIRQSIIEIAQAQPYAPIYIRAVSNSLEN